MTKHYRLHGFCIMVGGRIRAVHLYFNLAFSIWAGQTSPVPTTTQSPKTLAEILSNSNKFEHGREKK